MSGAKTIAKVIAGAAGAGLIYQFAIKDTTTHVDDLSLHDREPNSNVLISRVRIASGCEEKYRLAIEKSRDLVNRLKERYGAPGVVIGVSVDGQIIWEEGFGYSNVENRIPCHVSTTMRIASISKPITASFLATLWEEGKVDLDRPVQEYVTYFPEKKFNGKKVDITTRQLASHVSGIRHYKKKDQVEKEKNKTGGTSDSESPEFYIKERYDSLKKSIDIFKDDELFFEPGTSFLYTTHGYTLLSAVIEEVVGKPFTQVMLNYFRLLGLNNTHLDEVKQIIYNRSSYYTKEKKRGMLVNAELTDNSYKWAGGGFVSTVEDLLKFGNIMLYSYQQTDRDKKGHLKKEIVREMWTPAKNTKMSWSINAGYGLGWTVVPKMDVIGGVEGQKFYVGHGGGAVGASSVLVIVPDEDTVPEEKTTNNNTEFRKSIPRGVLVAVLTNLENVGCLDLAKNVAKMFSEA